MGYSEAFINRTKAQLLEHNRKLSREIAALNKEHDIQVESYHKVVEENKRLRDELAAKEESNKKLADQFYDYRTELDKVRKELADALENRNSLKVELEGVRGALKREAEMRVESKKKCDELCEKLVKMGSEFEAYRKSFNDKDIECDKYRQEMTKWKNEAGDYHNRWDGACIENERLRHEMNEVGKIQLKHNTLTLESLDNALKQWDYIDGKLSRDLCMPLESLIQLLDEYGVNDFCKLRERLMYGPTTMYSNALASVRKLEKENKDLKAVADDLEKQRRELEQKLRRKTNDCGDWMDRAFRDEKELRKVKEHDRIAQENFEKAARRNDELQCEVNKLQQRWTDTFNPEDELLGRKVLEWQEINAVLSKYGISSPEILDNMISLLKAKNLYRSLGSEWRDVVEKYHVASPDELDKCLDQRQRMHHTLHVLKKDIEQFNQP